jgi:hypothetical protein
MPMSAIRESSGHALKSYRCSVGDTAAPALPAAADVTMSSPWAAGTGAGFGLNKRPAAVRIGSPKRLLGDLAAIARSFSFLIQIRPPFGRSFVCTLLLRACSLR